MTELAADAAGGADGPLASTSDERAEVRPAADSDPERALAEFPLRTDDDTLREVVDEPWPLERIRFALTRKLATATDNASRARLYGLRAVTDRLLGKLKDALDDAEEALRYAETTGSARRIAVASTRLARVLQWRGEHEVADAMYQRAIEAEIPNRLRAEIHFHFGSSCYDQGRFVEALQHFETVLALRPNQDPAQLDATDGAFAAISRQVSLKGFGPLPRTRADILQEQAAPLLRFHDVFKRYGYTGPDGDVVIPPTFREAYPFAGGVAWVRPDDTAGWALIDALGETLIPATGFRAVGPFHEGLAWVVADPATGWYAIDSHGTVAVPPAGYLDVRPFHSGLAAVRRHTGWGAVDRHGRLAVPAEYDGFRTASSEATYLTGFTMEGLAVVERDGLLGVVNRAGEPVVPLEYLQVEIHPVGYLVLPPPKNPDYSNPFRVTIDLADGWGALDRRGQPVVDAVHPNRPAVLEELEKLMRDAHPIL